MTMIPFLILALGVLFGVNFAVYFSAIRFFGIASNLQKAALIFVLFILSLSFVVFSTLSHAADSFLLRIFCFLSSLWLGVLINLLLAAAVGWLFVLLGRAIDFKMDMQFIGTILALFALGVSVLGTINTFNLKVKTIEAEIKNLPEEWKGKTIVQLSDLHLGNIYRAGFLNNVVKKVNALNPDLVVITGDLFDGADGNLDSFIEPLNNIKSPNGVFFVTGNHEIYLGLDNVFSVLKKTNIRIMNDEVVDVKGLQMVGVNYPQQGESKNIKEIIEKSADFSKNKPSILLYHSPAGREEAKEAGINLQLSGHTHKGQIFPVGFITKIIYKGYDYGFYKDGDYSIYATNGVGTWGPPMRTGNTPEIVVIELK